MSPKDSKSKWQAVAYIAKLLKSHLMITLVSGYAMFSIVDAVTKIKIDNTHKFWLAVIAIIAIILILLIIMGYTFMSRTYHHQK